MFRNRLLFEQLVLMAALGLIVSLFAWWLMCFDAFVVGLVVTMLCVVVAGVFARRRYGEIARLAAALDETLHGSRTVTFDTCREGDIAVLSNEIQKLTARLVRTSDLLAQEKQALAGALEDISHQIRTPLTSVGLMVPLIAGADSLQERKHLLRDLERLVGRTSWLVTALLQLAKLDAGALELESREVEVQALFRRAAEPLLLSYNLKNVTLTFEETELAQYRGDERWGAEALGNVLKNCLEHTPSGGQVAVVVHETTLATTIRVTDTGSGFRPEDLPHVFERFYRGGTSQENVQEEGFGIGLAFARALTEAQGGSLVAANNDEGGAKFVFTFPKLVV